MLEVVIAGSICSIIGTIIITQLLQRNWHIRLNAKKDYETEMYKLKKRETRKDRKIAVALKTKAPAVGLSDWIDKLRGIKPETLELLTDAFSRGEEIPAEAEGIEATVVNFIKNNPALVEKGLSIIQGNKAPEDTYI